MGEHQPEWAKRMERKLDRMERKLDAILEALSPVGEDCVEDGDGQASPELDMAGRPIRHS